HLRHLPSFPTRRSSDLMGQREAEIGFEGARQMSGIAGHGRQDSVATRDIGIAGGRGRGGERQVVSVGEHSGMIFASGVLFSPARSEEHTSELQSLTNLV